VAPAPSNHVSIATSFDITAPAAGPAPSCDHDGKASGRLVLEDGRIRREIVCECGEVLMILGRQSYNVASCDAARRGASRQRWMRSRALLFSARRVHAVDALHKVRRRSRHASSGSRPPRGG
jgi:hypothetical protein